MNKTHHNTAPANNRAYLSTSPKLNRNGLWRCMFHSTQLKEMKKVIEFFCWEKDEPIEIQLEPEAFTFMIQPGESLKFEPVNSADDFQWSLRISHQDKGIQLFPDTKGSYDGINIYKNGQLEENWTSLYSQ